VPRSPPTGTTRSCRSPRIRKARPARCRADPRRRRTPAAEFVTVGGVASPAAQGRPAHPDQRGGARRAATRASAGSTCAPRSAAPGDPDLVGPPVPGVERPAKSNATARRLDVVEVPLMTGIRVTTTTDDLEGDLRYIATHRPRRHARHRPRRDPRRQRAREGLREGQERSAEPLPEVPRQVLRGDDSGLGLFGNTISGEYGPRHEGQGMLAGILENGSRKRQRCPAEPGAVGRHHRPVVRQEVRGSARPWFWPNR
jgi:hypothetical protein